METDLSSVRVSQSIRAFSLHEADISRVALFCFLLLCPSFSRSSEKPICLPPSLSFISSGAKVIPLSFFGRRGSDL